MRSLRPSWLEPGAPPERFPDPASALSEPNGLLAAGGDLSPERLMCGYRRGIFPWYSEGQPILWWSPNPRTVLFPEDLHVSRSLGKTLRRDVFQVSLNRAFSEVLRSCAAPRATQPDTWITAAMQDAYQRLHRLGFAHSVECWRDGELVGGLYGVSLGQVFYGESMFSRASDASKVALVHLARMGFQMIDCQMETPHLRRMGAVSIEREDFLRLLDAWCESPEPQRFAAARDQAA